jgi:uncharacterized membrane protein
MGLVLLFVLVTLEVRQGFAGGVLALGHGAATLAERGTYGVLWLAAGMGLVAAGRGVTSRVVMIGGYVFLALGAVWVVAGETLLENPLWVGVHVGEMRVVNWLVYAYGVPAALLGVVAVWLRKEVREAAVAAAVVALGLLFVLVTLEVRQGFAGAVLTLAERPGSAEMYAYSAAWAVLGTVLLVAGIATRGPILRWASLAVMLLAVLKVFLVDAAHLSDVYRVLSFFGLGLSLILLGLLYHYFVFRRAGAEAVSG